MKVGWTISAVGHAGVLAYALISIAATPLTKPPVDSLPIDIVSATDFSQLTKGMKTAPKADVPKPLVEKVGENKPTDNPAQKVVEKPEVIAAADEPPKPTPPKPEAKQAPTPPVPQPKPEPKQAFSKEEQKTDPIAEAIKRDEKKKRQEQKQAEQQKKQEQKKAEQKFDASQIQQRLALLDKRDPQRRAATGETLSNTPALGSPTGTSMTLSQSEIDALRARIQQCWSPPVGLSEARDLIVVVRIMFNRDGSLQRDPAVTNHGSHPMFNIAAESALRAVRRCAPYSFMPAAKYDVWKDVEVNFDPRDMFRG